MSTQMEDVRPIGSYSFQGEPITSLVLTLDDSQESAHVRELVESWGVPYEAEYHPGVQLRLPVVRVTVEGASLMFRGQSEIADLFLPGVESHPLPA